MSGCGCAPPNQTTGNVPTIAGKAFPECKPCCPPEPHPCAPPCDPPVHVIRCYQKIRLTCDTLGTLFPAQSCGCSGPAPNIANVEAWIRRRGECEFRLKYPAWDVSCDGWIEFRWDDQLFALKPGRYEAELRNNGFVCGRVELIIGPDCTISARRHRPLQGRVLAYPTTKPAGANAVYDAIAGYKATLCAVLERGATVLPLCGPDLAALCAASLCKPVQLMISDGVNSELITFSGCVTANAAIERGSPQFKFPIGSEVTFVWSAQNVAGAMTPCP